MDFLTFITNNDVIVCAVIFCAFSIPIAVYDAVTGRIPDILSYGGTLVLLCYRFACTRREFPVYFLSGAACVLVLLLVRQASGKGLGMGDIKYSPLCGVYAGPVAVFLGFLLAAAFCGIYILILKAAKKWKNNKKIPFAPFMAIGTLLSSIPAIINFFLI